MSARAGAEVSPVGGGTCSTTAFSRSITPSPVLAETRITSPGSQPMMPPSSSAYLAGWAAGRSILFSTGMMCRSDPSARYRLASVCASIPCAALTSRMAPSQAASDRETS